ncbi:mast cell protease 1A-like isoform X1 [Pieris brassicae]|uniref:mast cell protease 1A-like isoform X1 n=1 Tax=Pieris brassicae TaxID=7116 RepID=UPI001E660AD1|nr:mast cell protease 1A-like isoform X1 [Pieris brassicae]XP_045527746.1 mast cell protease 1A-like isoform X1 [Pieris brassicae]
MSTDVVILLLIVDFSLGSSFEGKVIGGKYATIKNFPHVAFLKINVDYEAYICGSSVLNQLLLVSAAHCFELIDKRTIIGVYAGHHDIFQVKLVRLVKTVYRHKSYHSETIANDIALIKLKHALPFGEFIKRVILRPNIHKEVGILAGWGATNSQMSEFDYKLKCVSQKLRSKDDCSRIGTLHKGMICAGSFNSNHSRPSNHRSQASATISASGAMKVDQTEVKYAPPGVIRGDSGSGLIGKDYQIVGIVSHLVTSYPAIIVYTNVSHYYSWIHQKAAKILCPIE